MMGVLILLLAAARWLKRMAPFARGSGDSALVGHSGVHHLPVLVVVTASAPQWHKPCSGCYDLPMSESGQLGPPAASAQYPLFEGILEVKCSLRVFPMLIRMRHHASFMMPAVPDTLIELPAISLISARISDRIPMSSP
jgi:hypothetical protein